MLVISRKVGEKFFVGEEITITVVRVSNGGVRIGIEAPKELSVMREELVTEEPEAAPANKLTRAK